MHAAYLASEDDNLQDVITVRPVTTSGMSPSNLGRQHSPITTARDGISGMTPVGTPVREVMSLTEDSQSAERPATAYAIVQSPMPMTVIAKEEILENGDVDPNAPIDCPFKEFGCARNDLTIEIKKHIRDDKFEHLAMMCDSVLSFRHITMDLLKDSERPIIIADDIIKKTTTIATMFSSQLIWRIDKYQKKYNAAKSGSTPVIYSPPFLSHRHGYRLSAAYGPFGDGDTVREFSSVFISILRDENDGMLVWPFACPIIFTMVNQRGGADITKTLTPRVVPENDAFLGRPTAERNPAFGVQQFVPLIDLNNSGSEFVVDDVMFIKIDVDIHDLSRT